MRRDTTCARCNAFVQLPNVEVLDLENRDGTLVVHVQSIGEPVGCPTCGVIARVKDRRVVELVDLPIAGTPTRLSWRKRRWRCLEEICPQGSWTEENIDVAPARHAMTTRAGRWATYQVGANARSVAEVARELGCAWHTINDAVTDYGEVLLDDPERFGDVDYLGLDETAFVRVAPYYRTEFSTQIVDVGSGQLLDVLPGRKGAGPAAWLKSQGPEWLSHVQACTLDLSSTYRSVFDECVPHATMVADPFHVIKIANAKLDECRRRVQNETLGHRGHKNDPLYRIRRLLTKAAERLDSKGEERLTGLLTAGDPHGDVAALYTGKECVRELYSFVDFALAGTWIDDLIRDMADPTWPVELRSLGRTLKNWRDEIIAWHKVQITNGPTEGVNNLIKRVKRAAFGFRSFRNYRVRALLYAGWPNWEKLAMVTPP